MRPSLDQVERALRSWVASELADPRSDVSITDLCVPRDGASNGTVLFSAAWPSNGQHHHADLVLRLQLAENQLFLDADVFHQARVMMLLAEHSDIPVPRVVRCERNVELLGTPFFVMERVHGRVANGYQSELLAELDAERRRNLYMNGLAVLARIHQLEWYPAFGSLSDGKEVGSGLHRYIDWVGSWYDWAAAGERHGPIEAGLRYLNDQLPADAPTTLIWGDSRPGNLLIDPSDASVASVLDWELATLATPEADIGWWLMFERRFSEGAQLAVPDGVPTRDEILTAYEGYLGRPLGDVNYFDVLAWTRIGITFLRHVHIERGGPDEALFRTRLAFIERCLMEHVER